MKNSYLQVTFRHGRPLAAYLYLPRQPADKSYRTKRAEPGLVIDFNRRGKPIGIEITAPAELSATALNRVLRRFGLPGVTRADLAPLRAACHQTLSLTNRWTRRPRRPRVSASVRRLNHLGNSHGH